MKHRTLESHNLNPASATPPAKITCAKCGACTAVCPLYQLTGQEQLTARGKLHLLLPRNGPPTSRKFIDIFSKCLLCGACLNSCPRGIDTPALIIKARQTLPRLSGLPSFKKYLLRITVATPLLLRLLTKVGRALRLLPRELPAESGLHLKIRRPQRPPPARQPFQESGYQASENHPKKVLYFTGCLANYLATDIAKATCRLIDRVCRQQPVTLAAHCCGMAALAAGDLAQARALAKKNISRFSTAEAAALPIITSCATCFSQLTSYPSLFEDDQLWREKAAAFAGRVWEFSRFLLQHGQAHRNLFRENCRPETLLYHDPCHLRFHRDLGNRPDPIVREPRALLRWLPNQNLTELPHGPRCCGQGGLFHLSHPELADAMTRKAVNEFARTPPAYLLTTCSGCLLQWRQGVAGRDLATRPEHLAVFLAKRL